MDETLNRYHSRIDNWATREDKSFCTSKSKYLFDARFAQKNDGFCGAVDVQNMCRIWRVHSAMGGATVLGTRRILRECVCAPTSRAFRRSPWRDIRVRQRFLGNVSVFELWAARRCTHPHPRRDRQHVRNRFGKLSRQIFQAREPECLFKKISENVRHGHGRVLLKERNEKPKQKTRTGRCIASF